MNEPRAPRVNREGQKNKAEYSVEDIRKLLLWSFSMSQGSGLRSTDSILVHSNIFPALFAMYPTLVPNVHRWIRGAKWAQNLEARKFEDDEMDEDATVIRSRDVEAYVQQVLQYRGNEVAHVQEKLRFQIDDRAQAYKALQYFLKELKKFEEGHARRSLMERAEFKKSALHNLAVLIISRDKEILEAREKGRIEDDPLTPIDNPEAERLRVQKGHSMFCAYALSENRVARRAFLSPEYQKMWEVMGEDIRKGYKTLDPETRVKLDALIQKFEETTGEKVWMGVK